MIVVVGDIGWDFVASANRLPSENDTVVCDAKYDGPGGGSANTAANIAGADVPVALIAGVGRDPLGDALRRACSTYTNLHAELDQLDGPTQVAMILMSATGERTVIVSRRSPPRTPSPRALEIIRKASLVWVNEGLGDVRREYWSAATCRTGVPLAHLEEEADARRAWHVVVGSSDDHAPPSPSLLTAVDARLCVLTQGRSGGTYWTPQEGWTKYEAARAPVVRDTLGAGDAFLAGLLVGLSETRNPSAAVRRAAEFGSKAVGRRGGWPGAG